MSDELDEERYDDDHLPDDGELDELCPQCGLPIAHELESAEPARLTDIVIASPGSAGARSTPGGSAESIERPAEPGTYGEPSTYQNEKRTNERCLDGQYRACPQLVGHRDVKVVDGVIFDYIGGTEKRPAGLVFDKQAKRWEVDEPARIRNRKVTIQPRTGDGLRNFIANMKAAGLEIEAILTMGAVNCRCIGGTNILSDHRNGDAFDVGGVRFVESPVGATANREVLVASYTCDPDARKLLHRINACLRLSFARVLDYFHVRPRKPYACSRNMPKGHWNHIHCDTNQGRPLIWVNKRGHVNWKFVRRSLGLPPHGVFDKACADALRSFAGRQDAVTDAATTMRTLSALYMREAVRI